MDPKQELSVLFGTSQQSIVDQILRDSTTTPFDSSVRIPCRTKAYKGYVKMQRKQQKKPFDRIPRALLEEK